MAAANRLIGVMGRKKKPEGMSDADWQRTRNDMLGNAYMSAGIIQAGSNRYADADRNLKSRAAIGRRCLDQLHLLLPGGVSNYQMGKLTTDKAKMATGLQYTDEGGGHRRTHARPGVQQRRDHEARAGPLVPATRSYQRQSIPG